MSNLYDLSSGRPLISSSKRIRTPTLQVCMFFCGEMDDDGKTVTIAPLVRFERNVMLNIWRYYMESKLKPKDMIDLHIQSMERAIIIAGLEWMDIKHERIDRLESKLGYLCLDTSEVHYMFKCLRKSAAVLLDIQSGKARYKRMLSMTQLYGWKTDVAIPPSPLTANYLTFFVAVSVGLLDGYVEPNMETVRKMHSVMRSQFKICQSNLTSLSTLKTTCFARKPSCFGRHVSIGDKMSAGDILSFCYHIQTYLGDCTHVVLLNVHEWNYRILIYIILESIEKRSILSLYKSEI